MAKRRKSPTAKRSRRKNPLGQWMLALLVLAGVFLLFQLGTQLSASDGLWTALGRIFSGGGRRIGLVAGHWRHDSGAVCPDGLEEVQINLDVAQRTAVLLRRAGYTVDLLASLTPSWKATPPTPSSPSIPIPAPTT
ncbi:MAG: hypothetical protein ACUVWB_12170 [Anaerolineae bacterium]